MNKWSKLAAVALFGFLFLLPTISHADITQESTQGEFALWLVKAIGAQDKLSPAASADDAIEFLTKLGVIPEGGWKQDEKITKELLGSFLDDPNLDLANTSFDDLLKKVIDHVKSVFDDRKLAIFGVTSASSSVPIG